MLGLIVLDERSDSIGLLISEKRFSGYGGVGSIHDRGIYGADAALKLNLNSMRSPASWNGFRVVNGLDSMNEQDFSSVRALEVTLLSLYEM